MLKNSTDAIQDAGEHPWGSLHQHDRRLIRTFLRVAQRRRVTIFVVLAVSMSLAGLCLALTAPRYTATTRLLTDTSRSHSVTSTTDSVDSAVIDSQIETIRSKKIAVTVIRKLRLDADSEFIDSGLATKALAAVGLGPSWLSTDAGRLQQAIVTFGRDLEVLRIGRSYAADISFTSLDRERAALVANMVAEAYIKDQLDARGLAAERASSWIQEKIDELRHEYGEAASALEKFRSEANPMAADGTAVINDNHLDAEHQARLLELESSVQSSKRLYETFLNLNRYSQAPGVQSFPITDARVVAEALPPLERSSPRIGYTLLLSLAGGCGLALLCAFAREYIDRSIRTGDQLEQDLGVKSLGFLPICVNTSDVILSSDGSLGHSNDHKGRSRYKLPMQFCTGSAADILRNIRAAIDDIRGPSRKIVGITSLRAGEGKTTLAFNLAMAIAKSGKQVLVIDGDLRTGSLTDALAPDRQRGLIEVLDSDSDLRSAASSHFGFRLLPHSPGPAREHAADILSSPAMKKLLDAARKEYHYVLVDLPSIQPHSDVRASVGQFHAFILVSEWGRTAVDEVESALGISNCFADRLLGVVINKKPSFTTI